MSKKQTRAQREAAEDAEANLNQDLRIMASQNDRIDPHFASILRQIVKVAGLRRVREFLDLLEREGAPQ